MDHYSYGYRSEYRRLTKHYDLAEISRRSCVALSVWAGFCAARGRSMQFVLSCLVICFVLLQNHDNKRQESAGNQTRPRLSCSGYSTWYIFVYTRTAYLRICFSRSQMFVLLVQSRLTVLELGVGRSLVHMKLAAATRFCAACLHLNPHHVDWMVLLTL